MKIRTKLFIYTTLIAMVVVTFTVFLLWLIMPVYYENDKKKENLNHLANIEALIKKEGATEKSFSKVNKISRKSNVEFYLFDAKQQLLYPRLQVLLQEEAPLDGNIPGIEELNSTVFNKFIYQNNDYYTTQSQFVLPNQQKVTLFAVTPLQPISDAKNVFLDIYPYILLSSFLIGIVGAWIYSYFSTRRILKMIQLTEEMTRLRGTKLNQISGRDELSLLAKNINYLYLSLREMIDKLDEENEKVADLERAKAEFMRIASHELKTPITALSGLIDGMRYNVGEFKDRDKYLEKCREILDEQTQLVKDILYTSQLDLDDSMSECLWFDLAEQVSIDSAVYEILAKSKEITFKINMESQKVYGRESDFQKIVQNVLSNALKYTKEGGEIHIYNEEGSLMVDNTCVPFQEEDSDSLFDAFSRPDFARNRQDGGSGLGLFIVKQLVEKNQWNCSLEPKKEGDGMQFKLEF